MVFAAAGSFHATRCPMSSISSSSTPARFFHLKNTTISIEATVLKNNSKKRNEIIGLPILSLQDLPQIRGRVHEIFQRQSKLAMDDDYKTLQIDQHVAEEGYERCRKICAEYSKTFYLGTLMMRKEQQRAVWAIYGWGRRIDDLVDGPMAEGVSVDVLDQWEDRLEDIFKGKSHDIIDIVLTDTVSKFHLDIQPFKDVIEGMRMDINKKRYKNFEELCLYSYYVNGAGCLMLLPLFGIGSNEETPLQTEKLYNVIAHASLATQISNILRDVGEDASRGRIYLPQDELARFGLSDEDVLSMKVTDRWINFMKEQIKRARFYYQLAEEDSSCFDKTTRLTIIATLRMYSTSLDGIEENDYNNFTKRADVGRIRKLLKLPQTFLRAIMYNS
ncbi:cyclase [Lithospermum erythrorhizon]|uniref:15-cis-phytoene synthase n=1 Tax=Lithospermum erythrorhizon TaxID=34254 RepID=A0AAV3RVV4_LITER